MVGNGVVAEQLQDLLLSLVEPVKLEAAEKDFPHNCLAEDQMAFVKVQACGETTDLNTATMATLDHPNIRNVA